MFDFTKLEQDLSTVAADVRQLFADIEQAGIDLESLFQATPEEAHARLAASSRFLGKVNWQNLVCVAIPIYDMFAATQGWPVIPLPAFCSAPTPTPTPTPVPTPTP